MEVLKRRTVVGQKLALNKITTMLLSQSDCENILPALKRHIEENFSAIRTLKLLKALKHQLKKTWNSSRLTKCAEHSNKRSEMLMKTIHTTQILHSGGGKLSVFERGKGAPHFSDSKQAHVLLEPSGG